MDAGRFRVGIPLLVGAVVALGAGGTALDQQARLSAAATDAATSEAASGVLVLGLGRHLVEANADGSGLHLLTSPGPAVSDSHPAVSPDGSLVAFERWTSDSFNATVVVMPTGGGAVSRVGTGISPMWSPGGSLLAYRTVDAGFNVSISVCRSDGSERRRLVTDAGWIADWSPDGRSIAYTNDTGIAVVDADTGARRLLRKSQPFSLAWSPQGTRIAYSDDVGVWVIDADGSHQRRVGPVATGDYALAWSPDGRKIAYGRDVPYGSEKPVQVVVVDADAGKTIGAVPALAGGDADAPAWSPDGGRIAFLRSPEPVSFRGTRRADVWVVDANGSNPLEVTRAFPWGGSGSLPRWLPGVASVTPDPLLPSTAVDAVQVQKLDSSYRVAAVDKSTVALVGGKHALGIWDRKRGLTWLRARYATRVSLSGRRVYWSYWGDEGRMAGVWTATWPGGRPTRLFTCAGVRGTCLEPTVEGDHTLAVYSYKNSLWRLRGLTRQLIRREKRNLEPLSVSNGRILLRSHARLEVVDARGRLLVSIPSHSQDFWACLSGSRLIVLSAAKVTVYQLPGANSVTTWPVGATGSADLADFPYQTLFPYRAGVPFHVLDVENGHDAIITIGGRIWPTTVGISQAGLFYTAAPPYTGRGEVGFVPLAAIRQALR